MAITKIWSIKSTLKKAIEYICNEGKTEGELLVSSFGCAARTADIEFEMTRSQGTKRGDVLAMHLLQSFVPGEVTAEEAHQIGKEFAREVLRGQYEFIIATHVDKHHIHNHIIFNSTSFINKRKYHSNLQSYKNIQRINDKICKEHHLSTIEKTSGERGKSHYEYEQKQRGTSWKAKLKSAIDQCIEAASDFEEFLLLMQMEGYEIKRGEHISFRAIDQKRFTRARTIGEQYSEDAIKKRILKKDQEKDEEQFRYTHQYQTFKKKIYYRKIDLIVNIQECIKAQESSGYRYVMEIQNINQTANTLNYLLAHKLQSSDDFIRKYNNLKKEYHNLRTRIRKQDDQMMQLSETIKYGKIYWKYKKTYSRSRREKPGSPFFKEHEKELKLFEAAKRNLEKNGISEKALDIKGMIKKYQELKTVRDDDYRMYQEVEKEYKELEIIRQNLEKILRIKFDKEGVYREKEDRQETKTREGSKEKR